MGLLNWLHTRRNKKKGKIGEKEVKTVLNPALFDVAEHKLINDLTLMDENGKSHQIDHIEIRKNGIFCIETKNYSGIIFGKEKDKNWTQCLSNGRYKIFNPIKQNYSHIYHLNKILNDRYKINSLVVLVQNNADNIKVNNVINLKDLSNYLDKFYDGTNYSFNEIDYIFKEITYAKSNTSIKRHIENIEKTKNELNAGICPKCGSKLVMRTGTHSTFYGCSSYPKCTYIKNIE